MSNNLTIVVNPTYVQVTLQNFLPDGPLRFTSIFKVTKVDPTPWEENGICWNGGSVLRFTITPGVPDGNGGYQNYVVLDFNIAHPTGSTGTIAFYPQPIQKFCDTTTSRSVAMLGTYAFFQTGLLRGDLTSTSYWALRKALPYPVYE